MPYIANKTMNLSGKVYAKGEHIPDSVYANIPAGRQGALTRTRLVIEVETVPEPPGDMCPHCGDGPFQRLAQHVSLQHREVLLTEDEAEVSVEESVTDSPEETDGNS